MACWDLNSSGICDALEDVNSDAVCDVLDCQAPLADPGDVWNWAGQLTFVDNGVSQVVYTVPSGFRLVVTDVFAITLSNVSPSNFQLSDGTSVLLSTILRNGAEYGYSMSAGIEFGPGATAAVLSQLSVRVTLAGRLFASE